MNLIRSTKNILFIISGFSILYLTYQINQHLTKPFISITKQASALNLNDELISVFSFGQQRALSSFLWITTLIESDTHHYNKKDLNSWMFRRFNSILKLDPKFYKAYKYGGQYLSIIKDDITGANHIYKKGIDNFPEDFWLRFYYGFNLLYEIQDKLRAIEQYEIIVNDPLVPLYAPYLPSILSKLKIEQGDDLLTAYNFLLTIYNATDKKTYFAKKTQVDLYSIKAEMDLECLNANRPNCNGRDFLGNPYIKMNKNYKSKYEFKKFRIKNRQK